MRDIVAERGPQFVAARPVAHEGLDRLVILEALSQARAAVGERLPERTDAVIAGSERRGEAVEEGPGRQR